MHWGCIIKKSETRRNYGSSAAAVRSTNYYTVVFVMDGRVVDPQVMTNKARCSAFWRFYPILHKIETAILVLIR